MEQGLQRKKSPGGGGLGGGGESWTSITLDVKTSPGGILKCDTKEIKGVYKGTTGKSYAGNY